MKYLFSILAATTLFCSPVATQAQQPLNMDFELPGAEGPARPWGWQYYWLAPHAEAAMDSTVAYSGKYSLRISGKEAPDDAFSHTLGYWIDPWGLKGKRLELKGRIKADNLVGNARITLAAWGEAGKLGADTVEVQGRGDTPLTTSWTSFGMAIEVDTASYSIAATVGVQGSGSAWFDAFRCYADGETIEEAPVAPEFSAAQMEWLSRHSTPLEGSGATPKGKFPDSTGLAAFRRIAGDAQLIALGESTHGTGEFFRIKHRLLECAVREMGATVFAIEANQLAVEAVNRYVLFGEGGAREAMSVMFNVWNTKEMLALIEWMRAYNLKNPQNKVEFVGFDMQDPQLPIDSLLAFLADYAPEVHSSADSLLNSYREAWRQQYYPSGPDSVRQCWLDNAREVWRLVSEQEEYWRRQAKTPEAKRRVEWAIQNARVIRRAARTAFAQDIASRDEAMAENIGWLLAQRPPATRMIIWAHDSHISRGESPDSLYNYFQGNSMGAHLARRYGGNYRAFGLSTYSGTYSATLNFQNRAMVPIEAFPSPGGSLDEALHRIATEKKAPGLILDLRPGRDQPWLLYPRPVRFIGYMASDYSYEAKMAIPYQFDGLVFIDETSHSKMVE
ncbi:MAG: erythromycin esterase family protein [Phaeodactylibacter sp.]|nr:erythromycin esterase family protein [Phaeodactylibacter sp.]